MYWIRESEDDFSTGDISYAEYETVRKDNYIRHYFTIPFNYINWVGKEKEISYELSVVNYPPHNEWFFNLKPLLHKQT
jgi:hypothetical protein